MFAWHCGARTQLNGYSDCTASALSAGAMAGFARVQYVQPAVDLLSVDYVQSDTRTNPRLQNVLDFVGMAAASPYGQRINPVEPPPSIDPASLARKRVRRVIEKMDKVAGKGKSSSGRGRRKLSSLGRNAGYVMRG